MQAWIGKACCALCISVAVMIRCQSPLPSLLSLLFDLALLAGWSCRRTGAETCCNSPLFGCWPWYIYLRKPNLQTQPFPSSLSLNCAVFVLGRSCGLLLYLVILGRVVKVDCQSELRGLWWEAVFYLKRVAHFLLYWFVIIAKLIITSKPSQKILSLCGIATCSHLFYFCFILLFL